MQHLKHARNEIASLQSSALSSKASTDLSGQAARVTRDAEDAAALTGDPVWKLWSRAPFIGSSLHDLHGVSQAVRDVAEGSLPTLVSAAKQVTALRGPDGRLDTRRLEHDRAALHGAVRTIDVAREVVAALPHSRFGAVETNRTRFETELDHLHDRATALDVVASTGSSLLGYHGSRRYLVAVQNTAEARALGGIVGAYVVLTFVDGKATVESSGSDIDLENVDRDVVDLGAEWRTRYEGLGAARDWREVTLTPDFPTAGKTMVALWHATQHGDSVDGVMSVDPEALASLLRATGPVATPRGTVLAAESFAKLTLSDVYRQYPDKKQRSAVFAEYVDTIFKAFTRGTGSAGSLAASFGDAISGGHLRLYSATPGEQAALARTPVAGALPVRAAPLFGVITQEATGDKLSYYLRREISYASPSPVTSVDFGDGKGPQAVEAATVRVTLRNTAPAEGLPSYVAPSTDFTTHKPLRPGRARVFVSIYLGRGGQLQEAQLDGRPVSLAAETEQGLAVLSTYVWLDPGASTTLALRVLQPGGTSPALTLLQQPTAAADSLDIDRPRAPRA